MILSAGEQSTSRQMVTLIFFILLLLSVSYSVQGKEKKMSRKEKFFHAVSSGDYKLVEDLIVNHLVDVNMKNEFQETPLHVSALSNIKSKGEILLLLLQSDADPNAQTEYKYAGHEILVNRTPLHWYSHSCDHVGIRLLLLYGADERLRTEEGQSSIEIIESIIKHSEKKLPECEIALEYLNLSFEFREKNKKLTEADFANLPIEDAAANDKNANEL